VLSRLRLHRLRNVSHTRALFPTRRDAPSMFSASYSQTEYRFNDLTFNSAN
jgi:hypothetical protein